MACCQVMLAMIALVTIPLFALTSVDVACKNPNDYQHLDYHKEYCNEYLTGVEGAGTRLTLASPSCDLAQYLKTRALFNTQYFLSLFSNQLGIYFSWDMACLTNDMQRNYTTWCNARVVRMLNNRDSQCSCPSGGASLSNTPTTNIWYIIPGALIIMLMLIFLAILLIYAIWGDEEGNMVARNPRGNAVRPRARQRPPNPASAVDRPSHAARSGLPSSCEQASASLQIQSVSPDETTAKAPTIASTAEVTTPIETPSGSTSVNISSGKSHTADTPKIEPSSSGKEENLTPNISQVRSNVTSSPAPMNQLGGTDGDIPGSSTDVTNEMGSSNASSEGTTSDTSRESRPALSRDGTDSGDVSRDSGSPSDGSGPTSADSD